jgi:hypothetical protein
VGLPAEVASAAPASAAWWAAGIGSDVVASAGRAWAGLTGLLGVALLAWSPAMQLPHAPGWVVPAASALAALGAAAAWQVRRAAATLAPVVATSAPRPRPVSRPVPGRQCDPATPGRARPRAPTRRAAARA